jgi:hypothetical protein
MQVLVSRAGLTLNPGQMADLVLAWRQVVGLLAMIPRDRPLSDDQAFVFRLPPPAASAKPAAAVRPRPAASPAGKKAAMKQPASKKAAVKQPGSKKSAGKKPASKKSASKKPARKQQAAARKTLRRRR